MKNIPILLSITLLAWSCTPGPEPIEYGADECDYCRMTIVDIQHGAEVVTAKGRVYKFDAIECMVHYVNEKGPETFHSFWVNDYTRTTGELFDATACTYLISPNIPSPMGAFLSAFEKEGTAKEFQQEKTGEVYTWEGLLKNL
jgi:copper chaperone NosL